MYKTSLEHAGVKGMKWGHRKSKYSFNQKLAIAGAGVAGFQVANYGLSKRHISFSAHLGLSLASAYAASQVTKKLIDKHGALRYSSISR